MEIARNIMNEHVIYLNKVQDLYHVINECPQFTEERQKYIQFLINGKDKYELYNKLADVTRSQIKAITEFMYIVQNNLKLEK